MRQLLILLGMVAFTVPQTPISAQSGTQVQLLSLEARFHALREIVIVTWSIVPEASLATMVVEHSPDSITFSPVGSIAYVHSGNRIESYRFGHVRPSRDNWYRIRFIFKDRGEQVTHAVRATRSPFTFVNPRPFGGTLQGDPDNPWASGYVTDIAGRPLLSFSGNEVSIDQLPSGIYVVHARNESGWHSSLFAKE